MDNILIKIITDETFLTILSGVIVCLTHNTGKVWLLL